MYESRLRQTTVKNGSDVGRLLYPICISGCFDGRFACNACSAHRFMRELMGSKSCMQLDGLRRQC